MEENGTPTPKPKKRREWGTGEIKAKNADGTKWLVRFPLRGTPKGKRQYFSKVIRGTKSEAQAFLRRKLSERDQGQLAADTRQTVDQWLQDIATMTRKPRTLAVDKEFLRLYIRPHIGAYRLSRLDSVTLQTVVRNLHEQGLATKTIRNALSTLSTALTAAVHPHRLIPFNPALGLQLPRTRKREMKVFGPEDVVRFMRAVEGKRHETEFVLSVCTGMRPEEYLGLQRRDVNLAAATIAINRILVNEYGKVYYDGDTKTDSGRRVLFVPEPALTLLKAHMLVSPFKAPDAPIFHDTAGQPINARSLYKHFQRVCRQAGLPAIRLYDLRHTYATLMHQAGVSPKEYGANMGHSSITITSDTYTHVLPAMQKHAVEKLEGFLQQAARTTKNGGGH